MRDVEAATAAAHDKRQREEWLRTHPGCRRRFGRAYLSLAAQCQRVEVNASFNNFITLAILVASVMVGLGTEPKFDDVAWMAQLESIILLVFVFECALKIVAQGARPLAYLNDPWNVFDLCIVLASVAPLVLTVGSFASIVKVFRLLRLLRIFKLAKQLKQLRIIVEALVKGFSSITYISLILFIFYYVFAIVAMLLFKVNDPHHFGNLHVSLLSLFRVATMDDWTDLMYINMFGCDQYGYDAMETECVAPEGWGYFSCVYFIVFVILGAQILLSLFIGVVTTAMAEAEVNAKRTEKLNQDTAAIVAQNGLSEADVTCVFALFNKLDIDREGTVSIGELEALIRILGHMSEDLSEKQVF
jgi:voltage-gated sodium channel